MSIKLKLAQMGFDRGKQSEFLYDWMTLLEDGFNPPDAIDKKREVAIGGEKMLCDAIVTSLSRGGGFSEPMIGWFPPIITNSIAHTEDKGMLNDVLPQLHNSYSKEQSIVSDFLKKNMYPITLFFLFSYIYVLLNDKFLTVISKIVVGELPGQYHFLAFYGNLIEHYLIWIVLAIAGVIWGLHYYLTNVVNWMRPYLDNVIVFKQYRQFAYSNFLIMLAMYLNHGIAFRNAIDYLRNNATPYLYYHLSMMQSNIKHTVNQVDAMNTGLIDPHIISRLRSLSESKGFANAMGRMATRAQEHANRSAQVLINIVFYLLTILDAILIGVAFFCLVSTSSLVVT